MSYMNSVLRVPLSTNAEQHGRLLALQCAFAEVCNAMSPVVQQTRCWNRVALHHMLYKSLRAQFPALGSQMVCNAIYSVSRTSRLIYQHPSSPFNLGRLGTKPLPLLRFDSNCPVYFDRHTLSVKSGQLSMYTLDGRMRFDLALSPAHEAMFHTMKLQEVVLARPRVSMFELTFSFADASGAKDTAEAATVLGSAQEAALLVGGIAQPELTDVLNSESADLVLPEYVLIEDVK